ncbi:MAG: sensor histidine kinase [Gammaproteobacteria bacterium]|nr:sensor histidine kinase [Gammaproteobacteria bacterium]
MEEKAENRSTFNELFHSSDIRLTNFLAECARIGVNNGELSCHLKNGKTVTVDVLLADSAEKPESRAPGLPVDKPADPTPEGQPTAALAESVALVLPHWQRYLSAQLQEARDEERSVIGREIHDELGQVLAAVQMGVSSLAEEYADHQHLTRKIHEMECLLNGAIKTVQKISAQLRPAVLEILGLAAAVDWQALNFQKTSGIPCDREIQMNTLNINKKVKIAIFRILQEGLTNVIRHSGATRVGISLKEKGDWLVLTIRDNGRGITANQLNDISSIGIRGMRERAHALAGQVRVFGRKNGGVTVMARIPLSLSGDPL